MMRRERSQSKWGNPEGKQCEISTDAFGVGSLAREFTTKKNSFFLRRDDPLPGDFDIVCGKQRAKAIRGVSIRKKQTESVALGVLKLIAVETNRLGLFEATVCFNAQ